MTVSNPSRPVRSSQETIHPGLDRLLERHRANEWRQPLHPPSVDAFRRLERLLAGWKGRLILDSGCGTGESTRLIARAHPGCLVIGVDKSASRLARIGAAVSPQRVDNAVWLRADLPTFWRLALAAGWRLHGHYLLYPNPWPKPGALQRRWHAHPVFPALLELGGRLEMRCNWEIYALEFAHAVNRILGTDLKPAPAPRSPVSSPFEVKYRASGHPLYAVVVPARAQSTR